MSSNILDDLIVTIRKNLGDVGFSPKPLILITTLTVIFVPFVLILFLALTQRSKPLPPPPGCHKLGLTGPSNLSDQHAKKYSQGGPPSLSNPWTVKALFIYPIKSCAPVELSSTSVLRTGFAYDRQFTFAQHVTSLPSLDGKVSSEWTVATQRTFPRLAKVEIEMWVPDPSDPGYDPENELVQSGGCIVMRFPFSPDVEWSVEGFKNLGKIWAARLWEGRSEPMVECRILFNPVKERIKKMKYKSEQIKIWKDTPTALNMGCEIPEEVLAKLKYTLGVTNPLTLFRIDTTKYRPVFKNAPKKEDVGFQTIIGMQDSYPLHILTLPSIHHVSSSIPRSSPAHPLNALRYRANIYIAGPPPFDEDTWTRARIGGTTFHISCRTTRCKLPNVDPETGVADCNKEPGTTMLKYRVIDGGSKSACLGMQVSVLEDGGKVSVGDEVEVLERGEHYFLKV